MITVTKRYAEDGRLPEQEDFTDEDYQKQPIEPWLKEIVKYPDFQRFSILYDLHETIVQKY